MSIKRDMTSSTPFNVPIVNLNSLKQHEISNNKGKLVSGTPENRHESLELLGYAV